MSDYLSSMSSLLGLSHAFAASAASEEQMNGKFFKLWMTNPLCFIPTQVYQGISAYASRLDNIVEFYGSLNLPQLPGLPPVQPVVLTANLKHYFESIGGATVRITFEDTEVKATGEPFLKLQQHLLASSA